MSNQDENGFKVKGFNLRPKHIKVVQQVAENQFEGNESQALRWIIDAWKRIQPKPKQQ